MRLLTVIFGLCLASLLPAGAAETTAPLQEGHRYLFVVDTSANVGRCKEAVERTVHDLVSSGMNGEMQPGDAIAIWTYRDQVNEIGFAPAKWTPPMKEKLANAAGQFVGSLNYDGNSFIYRALVEMLKVVRASKSVTILLISDGTETLQGTPFDRYTNMIYLNDAAEARRKKQPFVTALLAVDGKIVGCTVSHGGATITLPQMPESVKARLLSEREAAREAEARAKNPSSTAQPMPTPKPAAKELPKKTKPTPAQPAETPAPAPMPTTIPTPVKTSPQPATTATSPEPKADVPAPEPKMKTPAPVVASVTQPTPAPAAPTATPSAEVTVAMKPAPVQPPPVAEPETARETLAKAPANESKKLANTKPKPRQLAAIPAQEGFSPMRFLIIGVGLLVVAGVLAIYIVRSRRRTRNPSLISRGMGR